MKTRIGETSQALSPRSRRTFLLNLYPDKWVWAPEDEADIVARTAAGGSWREPWMTGGRRQGIESGDRVFLVQAGKAVFKQVKTGIIGDSDIEIIEGVKDGEEIIIGSYRTLRTLRNDTILKIEAPAGKGSK